MRKFKLKNIIKYVSAICGIFAICGLSVFALFGKQKDDKKVLAEDTQLLFNTSNEGSFLVGTTSTYNTYCNYVVNIDYVRLPNDANNNQQYRFIYTCYLSFTLDVGANHYIINNDGTTGILYSWNSDIYSSALDSGTNLNFSVKNVNFVRLGNNLPTYNVAVTFYYNEVVSSYVTKNSSWIGAVYKDGVMPSDNEIDVYVAPNLSNRGSSVLRLFTYTIFYDDGKYQDGYNAGYNDGYNAGYVNGNNNGYNAGYIAGIDDLEGQVANAYQQGYNAGFIDADNADAVTASAFTGIVEIAMLPVNFFLSIFNFEILGINLTGFIVAVISVILTYILIKKVL